MLPDQPPLIINAGVALSPMKVGIADGHRQCSGAGGASGGPANVRRLAPERAVMLNEVKLTVGP